MDMLGEAGRRWWWRSTAMAAAAVGAKDVDGERTVAPRTDRRAQTKWTSMRKLPDTKALLEEVDGRDDGDLAATGSSLAAPSMTSMASASSSAYRRRKWREGG